MPQGREGERQPIEIRHVVVRQQAQQTIRNLVDAIVELVTNSDDSYRRLEAGGQSASGKMEISVRRRKAGEWEFLEVSDLAEGMDLDRLLTVVHYGERASGFQEGRGVRGLFGRGLKEAIIALGEGILRSVKDSRESDLRIWWDEQSQQVMREIVRDSRPVNEPNGTRVTILSRTTEVKCPLFEKLSEQVSSHFALRDISSSKRREVFLTLHNVGGGRGRGAASFKQTTRLRFEPPAAREVERKTIEVSELGKVAVEIYEGQEKLDFGAFDPCSRAGLLVKTEGATLDNRLFGFDNYEAAHYFFGVVYAPGIARKVREGDSGIVDAARSGLQWKHPCCIELHEKVRELLKLHVMRKQAELASGVQPRPSEQQRRRIQNLCNLLNRFAREELEIRPEENGTGVDRADEITSLTIKPEVGNARPRELRTFSVYLPSGAKPLHEPARVGLQLLDTRGAVRLLQNQLALQPHAKHPELLTGRFQIAGDAEGDQSYIVARFAKSEDIAEFHVREPGKRPVGQLTRRKGGMFEDIQYDHVTPNPSQRVAYLDGRITVFLNFPPISDYLGPGGVGWDKPKGSLILAELVADAFSKEIVRRQIEEGKIHVPPGGQIDAFNKGMNDLMKRYLSQIHKALVV
jgi:hypothetical protein